MRRLTGLGALFMGVAMAGCGSSGGGGNNDAATGTDATTTPDVVMGTDVVTPMDTGGGGTDVPRTDVPADRVDAGPSNTCGRLAITDLNTMGMRAGNVTTIMGDNTAAAMMQGTTMPLRATSNATSADCTIGSIGQIAYRYTTGAMPAVLRISTTNEGTPRDFDTMLWFFTRCPTGTGTTVANAICNDDDPDFAGSADRRVSSLITTPIIPANTTIFIVAGGFGRNQTNVRNTGPYRLTVSELVPVAAGGACRTDGRDMRCAESLDCVASRPFSDTGVCRARGTTAGTLCRDSAPACDAMLRCAAMGEPAAGFCVENVMTGGTCSLFRACATGQTCVFPSRGSVEGSCRALGSAAGVDCRPMGSPNGQCDMGLQCDAFSNECRTPVAVGMACNTVTSICTGGATCVATHPDSFSGTCRANGTAAGTECRAGMTGRCDTGLACRDFGTGATLVARCVTEVPDGMLARFDAWSLCSESSACYFTDFSDRTRCRCGAEGTTGGNCRLDAPFCSTGLTCTADMPATGATGACQTQAMAGARCEFPTIGCADGFTCVLNADSDSVGTCRAEGSVAGAGCAPGATACMSGLTCNGSYLSGGSTCTRTVAMGAACDPLWGTTACPTGQVCIPTTYRAGMCGAATRAEMEPNNETMTAGAPVTASTTVTGALPRGDQDCVAVTVAANGGILAMASDGQGSCPARGQQGIVLDVYGSDGRTLLGEAALTGPDSCATIDGNRRGVYDWATGLSAGTYYVCARGRLFANAMGGTSITDSIASYVLTVAPLPPRS
jgi:hypothetical protein